VAPARAARVTVRVSAKVTRQVKTASAYSGPALGHSRPVTSRVRVTEGPSPAALRVSTASMSRHGAVRTNPWIHGRSPARPGPNHGQHNGMPPRIAASGAKTASRETQMTGS
jgi:hypothetical protein